jgi:DNA-binding NtrC family response regulator
MQTSRVRMVCVDDDQQILDNYREIFEDLGFEVKTGQNGFDLGCFIADELPDVMLVDLSMPGLNGLTALQRLSLKHKHLLARTIVVSGIIDTAVAQELRKLNVKSFKKPVNYPDLISAVNDLVRHAKSAS